MKLWCMYVIVRNIHTVDKRRKRNFLNDAENKNNNVFILKKRKQFVMFLLNCTFLCSLSLSKLACELSSTCHHECFYIHIYISALQGDH